MNAQSFPVTLKVTDLTKDKTTNLQYVNANVYTWLSPALKVQNPRQPNDWWYPMYRDGSIQDGVNGLLVSTGNHLQWTITLQATPGVYEWNPGAKSLGRHFINPTLVEWEGGNPVFRVAEDGTVSGTTEIVVNDDKYPGTPFNGAHTIPCVVQAEDFDNGGQGVAYNDSPGMQNGRTNTYRSGVEVEIENDGKNDGYHVGWTEPGEWLKYTIHADIAAGYNFIFTWATPANDTFSVDIDGIETGTYAVPKTSAFDVYASMTIPDVALSAGKHLIKVTVNHGNFDKFEVVQKKETGIKNPFPSGRLYAGNHLLHVVDFPPSASLAVYEVSGRKIAAYEKLSGDRQIPVSPGVYIVKIKNERDLHTYKISID
jgi:hypothetical protein